MPSRCNIVDSPNGNGGYGDFLTKEEAMRFARTKLEEMWIVHVFPLGQIWKVTWWCQ